MKTQLRSALLLVLCLITEHSFGYQDQRVIHLQNQAGPNEPYRRLATQDAENHVKSGSFRFYFFDAGYVPTPEPAEARRQARAMKILRRTYKIDFEALSSGKCWCNFRENFAAYGEAYNAKMLQKVQARFGSRAVRLVRQAGF